MVKIVGVKECDTCDVDFVFKEGRERRACRKCYTVFKKKEKRGLRYIKRMRKYLSYPDECHTCGDTFALWERHAIAFDRLPPHECFLE